MMKNDEKLTSVSHLKHLKSIPILIFHGKKDYVVPYEHGETLFRIATNRYQVHEKSLARFISLPDAGHNNIESLYLNDMIFEINKFILERDEETLKKEGNYVHKAPIVPVEVTEGGEH